MNSVFKPEEGRYYEFSIKGIMKMPPDDTEFFILVSPVGSRHLMPLLPFFHYELKAGDVINCRIDKVSCSGKIYFEPPHPHYIEGETAEFILAGTREITNSKRQKELMIAVTDSMGLEVLLPAPPEGTDMSSGKVNCVIDRIKKGRLFLSWPHVELLPSKLELWRTYIFNITGIVTRNAANEYFELTDPFGDKHYLKTKYYSSYKFVEQDSVECEVIAEVKPYQHYLEPLNPYYKRGEVCTFPVIRSFQEPGAEGSMLHFAVVRDKTGHEYSLPDPERKFISGSTLRARVDKIRMSKLFIVPE